MELHLALRASPLPAADPGRRPPPPRGNFATNCTAAINSTHISQEKFRSLDSWVEHNMLTFLKPVEKCWQPQDFLPDPSHLSAEELGDAVREIHERAAEIPDEVWVCMVGNMVTEEALPTYQSLISSVLGGTVAGSTPWDRWIRGWSAEENRHGDLLNKYLYLTGRLDMRQVEKTIQYLIGSGMDVGVGNSILCGFIYTCFQEKATFIPHGNTARLAKHHGDTTLAKICGLVAADEKRHAAAYTNLMRKLFEVDPNESMLAFAHVMQARVTMPASRMFDGRDPHLFTHFSDVSQKIGVYTVGDYSEMLDFFLKEWDISAIVDGLSPEGRRVQEYVCGLPEVMRKLAERADDRRKKLVNVGEPRYIPFSWIFNKQVRV
uniref:Palmitoyl-[acyl-carrier-protein] 4-desaturase 2, chloroplastic n=1 Tax=Ophrys arachnitiformis subsp. archipelagi TaxID=884019 RepID=STAD2_OPHAA|nr:RecName: Full=Palmitoyl-[acyl-carrier-protein] 4-desaturase 2, chloroplastic; AltName: Full=Acyl-[acyl-carrier-protein] desaturase 2; AltName: Full=Stearoyl-[acyl-carrier-protein] 9-desaturase 2; Short=Stearoyl-ACP desaturase 2; Flags: Precursor [Ophrys x arachnitiformis subsp. archipelagi]CBW95567.1 Stearoyl-ACP desaturase homologue 2 [Ophrys x arachnitiformis subsp. archipelagi]